jgi:hypothetical protein
LPFRPPLALLCSIRPILIFELSVRMPGLQA